MTLGRCERPSLCCFLLGFVTARDGWENMHIFSTSCLYRLCSFLIMLSEIRENVYTCSSATARLSGSYSIRYECVCVRASAPSFGDHATGMSAVAGILAALHRRSKTGDGDIVSTSLLRMGVFLNGQNITTRLTPKNLKRKDRLNDRSAAPNPLINKYKTKDGRFFWLLGFESDRHWPLMMEAIGTSESAKLDTFIVRSGEYPKERYIYRIYIIRKMKGNQGFWVMRGSRQVRSV